MFYALNSFWFCFIWSFLILVILIIIGLLSCRSPSVSVSFHIGHKMYKRMLELFGWSWRRIIDCIEIRPQYLGTQSDWFRLCSQVKTWERSQLCSSEHPIILCSQELRSERSQVWSWEHSELKTWKHWGFFLQGRKSGGFCFQIRKSCGNESCLFLHPLPKKLKSVWPWL